MTAAEDGIGLNNPPVRRASSIAVDVDLIDLRRGIDFLDVYRHEGKKRRPGVRWLTDS